MRPVDIEALRIRRPLTPFEDRKPPGIFRAADAHVIRHDVDDKAKIAFLETVGKAKESGHPAKLWIELVIHDIIAVHRTSARLLNRRCIDLAESKICEIWRDGRRIVERKALIELNAIGHSRRYISK